MCISYYYPNHFPSFFPSTRHWHSEILLCKVYAVLRFHCPVLWCVKSSVLVCHFLFFNFRLTFPVVSCHVLAYRGTSGKSLYKNMSLSAVLEQITRNLSSILINQLSPIQQILCPISCWHWSHSLQDAEVHYMISFNVILQYFGLIHTDIFQQRPFWADIMATFSEVDQPQRIVAKARSGFLMTTVVAEGQKLVQYFYDRWENFDERGRKFVFIWISLQTSDSRRADLSAKNWFFWRSESNIETEFSIISKIFLKLYSSPTKATI